MTIRRLKALLWLLAFGALLGAGYTFYDIYEGKQGGRYDPKDQQYYHDLIRRDLDQVEDAGRSGGYYPKDEYEKIWAARVDGSWPKVVDPADAAAAKNKAPPKAQVKPIGDVIDVSTIVWADEPVDRFVKLAYKNDPQGPGGKVRLIYVSQGSALRDPYDDEPYSARVLEIGQQTVTFQWGEEQVTVTPGLGRDGSARPVAEFEIAGVDDPTAGLDGVPEETLEVKPGIWVIGGDVIEAFEQKGAEILREDVVLRSLPPSADGKNPRSSVELKEVKPDSVAAKFGFASGDRIISVNGFPMTSEAAAMNWYKQNPNEHAYVIVFERLGQPLSKTIYNTSKS